jgi:hypothetical protein
MNAFTEVVVPAKELWYPTKVMLEQGAEYLIEVPSDQEWTDWWVRSGPQGGANRVQRPFRPWLRFPHRRDDDPRADFFTLIGTIGKSMDHAFVIGAGPRRFRAPVSGQLFCFANDLWLAYWNNKGVMRFFLTRTE